MTPAVLRCTQKLAKVLGLRASDLQEPGVGPHSEWYANLIWFDGRKCLLFTEAQTLFSFLVPDVRKADIMPMGPMLVGHVEFELAREELPVDTFGRLDPSQIHLAKTASRKILGSMVDLAFVFEHALADAGGLANTNVAEVNSHLRRHLLGAIGSPGTGRNYERPIKLVRELALRRNRWP